MPDEPEVGPMPTSSEYLRAGWLRSLIARRLSKSTRPWWRSGLKERGRSGSDFNIASSFRCDCARALGESSADTATVARVLIDALTSLMEYDGNSGDPYGGYWGIAFREAVSSALCAMKERAVPYLIAAMGDPDPLRRERIAGVLGCIGNAARAVVPTLIARLADPCPEVRAKVSEALKAISGGDSRDLRDLLLSPDSEVVYGALSQSSPCPGTSSLSALDCWSILTYDFEAWR